MHFDEYSAAACSTSDQDQGREVASLNRLQADPPGRHGVRDGNPIADGDRIPDEARYSRQVLFPGIGAAGQQRLAGAHAAIVGCGATGAAAASLLARAGVGTLTLIDRDFVEASNLQRQVLFDEADARAALPKAEAARRHIGRFNASIVVHAHIADLVPGNIATLLGSGSAAPQILLDGTDNFETRYLLNDFSVERGTPWIYAAAIGAYAATMNILPRGSRSRDGQADPRAEDCGTALHSEEPGTGGQGVDKAEDQPYPPTACLACIFPKPPAGNVETCDTAGILSTAVNLAASIQVTEALKFLTGQAHRMRRTLLSFELWHPRPGSNAFTGAHGGAGGGAHRGAGGSLDSAEIATGTPRPGCTVCGQRIFSHLAGERRAHITLCGRDSVQIHEHHRPMDFAALRARLGSHAEIEDLKGNDLLLRFRRGPQTLTLFRDGRAIVQGTTDPALARSLYARFVGV